MKTIKQKITILFLASVLSLPSLAYNEPICDIGNQRVFMSRGHSVDNSFRPEYQQIGSGVYQAVLLMDNKHPTIIRFDCRSKAVGDANNNYTIAYPGSCAQQLHTLICGE